MTDATTNQQTCPRRMQEFGPWKHEEGVDQWESSGNTSPICSFCGSIHPDHFMLFAKDGAALTPTDKNYKVYVVYPRFAIEGKFYFQHLNEEQKREFVDLVNARQLNIGTPGHFYVLPFFMRREATP